MNFYLNNNFISYHTQILHLKEETQLQNKTTNEKYIKRVCTKKTNICDIFAQQHLNFKIPFPTPHNTLFNY